jgi:chromosome segregation ATPase
MTPHPERLGRTLLGYRPEHVRQFILERDALITQAEKRIAAAESQEVQARAESAALRDRLVALNREVAELRTAQARAQEEAQAQADAATEPVEESPPVSLDYLREESHRIMEATELATRRIIEHAMESLDRQLEKSVQVKAELDAEMELLAAWREAAGTLQGLMGDTRVLIRDVPDRLREALVPLDGAVISLDERLAQLAELPRRRPIDAIGNGAPTTDGHAGLGSGPTEGAVEADGEVIRLEDEGEASYAPFAPAPPVPTGDPPPRAF